MPTNTTKFNLVKPLKSEKYNVDVFNGNADIIDSQIYSKTEVDTSLGNKVDKTTTVNSKALSSNITINASDVPNTPSGNISATNVQGALSELDNEKADKLMATNLVTNGDFSNGTTGFSGSTGVTLSANSNILSMTNLDGFSSPRAFTDTIPYVAGKKLYIRALVKATVETPNEIVLRILGSVTLGTIVNAQSIAPILNTQYALSGVVTVPADGSGLVRVDIRSTYSNSTAGKVTQIQYVLAIDLTALFGAGREPTKWQMDWLLSGYPNSWFNGTSEIGSIGVLMGASSGVQVVTPTLFNARTGTAQYVVSNDGLVVFRGTASGGSLNTNIFVLPDNIRPIATQTFPISANNAFGVITVGSNGEVRQTVGALTNVSLDGIVFKVGV